MKKTWYAFGVTIFLVLLLSGGAQALDIFLWQHDNGLRVSDPVMNRTQTSTDALARTMDALDWDYDRNTQMPNDLSSYDVFVTSLSFYCPG